MRLQDRPTFRASAAVVFNSMENAAEAVRGLSQAALYPSNCRVIDAQEAANTGAGDGKHVLLVLGFESADHPLQAWMARALELVEDHGGQYDIASVERSMAPKEAASGEHRKGAAGDWRNAFVRAPFYREIMVPFGLINDTFETSITWDRFADFHANILRRTGEAIERVTGRPGQVTCRFTHVYPDGPAPYFTFQAFGGDPRDLAGSLAQWREIKFAANEIVTSEGGTITHHHAVGRDHRDGYEKQTSPVFRSALAGAKQSLDPNGVMNPGVLIDPVGKNVGLTGILKKQ